MTQGKSEHAPNSGDDFIFWLEKLIDKPSNSSLPNNKNELILLPSPDGAVPNGFPPVDVHSSKENTDHALYDATMRDAWSLDQVEATSIKDIGPDDPVRDKLEEIIDTTPISCSTVDESDLPTPDQENVVESEDSSGK